MCTNLRTIKNCYGRELVVKCGRCPACMQEKAINRVNRIVNNMSVDTVPLFITLTYTNKTVPYIRYSDFVDEYTQLYNQRCYIYRDYSPLYVRSDSDYTTSLVLRPGTKVLETVDLPVGRVLDKFVTIHGQTDFDKVAVSYFPDAQNFIKRLNIYLYRKYGFKRSFSYYICTEYGPSSCRPHIHIILFVQKVFYDFQKYKSAIVKSWPFADLLQLPRSIEVATDVSSYLASYVNCADIVPRLFQEVSAFRQKHSYSRGFGLCNKVFKLPEIKELFDKQTLGYSVQKVRNGISSTDIILLPKYVISRYFPQHKGFARLNSFEIYGIVLRPSEIFRYSETLGIDLKQCYQIEVQYRNSIKRALCEGINIYDYAFMYSHIWALRSSLVLKDMYNEIKILDDYFELYDNIVDLYTGKVRNDTLFDLINDFSSTISNPNCFSIHMVKTAKLTDLYHSYNKNRKIRNFVLSQNVYI